MLTIFKLHDVITSFPKAVAG